MLAVEKPPPASYLLGSEIAYDEYLSPSSIMDISLPPLTAVVVARVRTEFTWWENAFCVGMSKWGGNRRV